MIVEARILVRMQARDVMTTGVTTIHPDATVREAAQLMLERRVSGLPVVDGKERLVGMVSEGDLMRRRELGSAAPRSWWLRFFAEEAARDYLKTHGEAVRDVMTSPVVSVRRATPLHEVARLLEEHRIKRVPVVDGGRLVGIVSRADLVRRIATMPQRPTARTAGDRVMRDRVMKALRRSGRDLGFVNVTVEHGVVHLWGGVFSNHERRALAVAAKAVEGVRKVEDHTSVIPHHVVAALHS